MSRADKVSQAIKKEVSDIIRNELKDPRIGFVTITKVEATADLRNAVIYYSVLGKPDDYKKTRAALDSSLGFIRKLVGRRIRLRLVPELNFRLDRSSEYSARIEEILNQIKEPNEPKDGGGGNQKK